MPALVEEVEKSKLPRDDKLNVRRWLAENFRKPTKRRHRQLIKNYTSRSEWKNDSFFT